VTPTFLILPGWQNSGPQHWQSQWERKYPSARRVEQRDWTHPQREDWVCKLDRTVASAAAPIILIAHSLGCITIAHWAFSATPQQLANIHAALLVAPADVDRPDCPEELRNFSPIPSKKLPFETVLVASTNDPFSTLERAETLARAWGSQLHNLGNAGHINADAGLGNWPVGETLLAALMNSAQDSAVNPENVKLIAES
jgi:predicted alpha/beta hydrolase family esterase